MKRVAYLSMDDMTEFVADDELTRAPLAARGVQLDTVPWRANVDFSVYDRVIIRSTWDYQAHAAAFFEKLTAIAGVTHLDNSVEVVRWNLNKTYLRSLADAGAAIVPTRWDIASEADVDAAFAAFDAPEIVVKPEVSANADHTYRLPRGAALPKALLDCLGERALFAQPFVRSVVEDGELSLFFFGLERGYSHAVKKTPKRGDFRVQEEHGGLITVAHVDDAARSLAVRALDAIPFELLYARVDMVRLHDDTWALMEVELIEPALYLRMDKDAPARFVDALMASQRGRAN